MALFHSSCLTIVALGVLVTSPALAESSVVPFGTLDLTNELVKGGNIAATGRVSSNSSGIGFRGREQLAPGLHAIFQIEGGISPDTGSGALNTRDTFVGLSGSWGTLRAGLMTTPLRALGGRLNFIPGGTSIANNMGVMSTLNGLHAGLNSRLPNSLQYGFTPTKALAAAFAFAPGEARPNGLNDYSASAGLNYEDGPWFAGWAHENRHAQRKQALGDSRDWESRLVLRYKAGELTYNLGWDRLASDGLYAGGGTTANGGVRRDAWTAGVMYKRGPHDVMLHLSRANDVVCSGNAISGQCAPAAVASTGARQVSVLYHYTFSKRTLLIAFYSTIRNEANGRYDFDANPVVAALAARVPGTHPTGVGWGIRHSY